MTFLDPADAPETQARLEALQPQIPELLTLDVGLDVVGSPASAHLLLLTTHDSIDALKAYQAHPVHQQFSAWVGPRLAARHVADIEV